MKPALREPDVPDVNLELEPLALELKEEVPAVDDVPAPELEELDENLDPDDDPEEIPPLNDPDEPELRLEEAGIPLWKQPAHNGPSPLF